MIGALAFGLVESGSSRTIRPRRHYRRRRTTPAAAGTWVVERPPRLRQLTAPAIVAGAGQQAITAVPAV